MELILHEIFRALNYLFIASIVYCAWKTSRDNVKDGKYRVVLLKGFLVCVGLSLAANFLLGSPSCVSSDQDVYGSTCYEYASDGYEPTIEQRTAHFMYYMTLLYVPVVAGAFKKNKNTNKISDLGHST